ncbi:MAG: hypothetical protein JWM80_6427 [Cyanobacteria bacterium RYN_339]|nr:hypothetical protein [Cyanobacteria bacterium RYN_339]
MRQGIVIFAATAPPAGSAAAEALRASVAAALAIEGVGVFLAYGDPGASQSLRKLVGGPPPRFFPQAARPSLGERMAQAFAFLFVQDYERVLLVQPGVSPIGAAELGALLGRLDEVPVEIDTEQGATMVALRRVDFPQIAPIFENVAWERPGAREAAQKILAEESRA